jgi:hypothetical protein
MTMYRGNTISIEEDILKNEIMNTIWYFDYFQHALALREIHRYLGIRVRVSVLRKVLTELVEDQVIHEKQGFYAKNSDSIIFRLKNEKRNRRWLVIAHYMGRLISLFPFVRSVFISGSLSKQGLRGEDDDIDFFLLVAPNRVWTAKFFLILFKKIFLFNSHKFFCINLLRDEGHLSFDRRNIYIATEIVSLIPIGRPSYWRNLLMANKWVFDYFPNVRMPKLLKVNQKMNFYERLLSYFIGPRFEEWCRNRFENHVLQKQEKADSHYEISSQSSAYFPNNFQGRVLRHYYSIRN